MIPPLILQPVIENAIWHGILPLQFAGKVTITVRVENGFICCIVDDNGIGREQSLLNKSKNNPTHHSKGMRLIEDRLRVFNKNSGTESSIQAVDKKDHENRPAGTQIIIKFKADDEGHYY